MIRKSGYRLSEKIMNLALSFSCGDFFFAHAGVPALPYKPKHNMTCFGSAAIS
jgi:hypothetical protein